MYTDRIVTLCLDGYASGVNPLDAYVALDTFNSSPLPIGPWAGYSIAVTAGSGGSPVGTVKLQGCNDQERLANNATPDANLANWFDVSSGGDRIVSASIVAGGTVFLTDPSPMYRWLRVKYTRTSGTITITVKVQRKNIR